MRWGPKPPPRVQTNTNIKSSGTSPSVQAADRETRPPPRDHTGTGVTSTVVDKIPQSGDPYRSNPPKPQSGDTCIRPQSGDSNMKTMVEEPHISKEAPAPSSPSQARKPSKNTSKPSRKPTHTERDRQKTQAWRQKSITQFLTIDKEADLKPSISYPNSNNHLKRESPTQGEGGIKVKPRAVIKGIKQNHRDLGSRRQADNQQTHSILKYLCEPVNDRP